MFVSQTFFLGLSSDNRYQIWEDTPLTRFFLLLFILCRLLCMVFIITGDPIGNPIVYRIVSHRMVSHEDKAKIDLSLPLFPRFWFSLKAKQALERIFGCLIDVVGVFFWHAVFLSILG